MIKFRPLRFGHRGNAAVEFALGFPVLMFATLIVFDIGRSLLAYTSVKNLAAEGTRYASVRGFSSPTYASAGEIEAYVFSRAAGLDLENLSVAVTFDSTDVTGQIVIVRVNYNLIPLASPIHNFPTFTVTGESRMNML